SGRAGDHGRARLALPARYRAARAHGAARTTHPRAGGGRRARARGIRGTRLRLSRADAEPTPSRLRRPPGRPGGMSLPFSEATGADVRVRFCPSPTGTPHVGMVRTALFNWAYARHTGGKLVFRVEDTDAARDSEESYLQLVDALEWLGIDWDEGVEKGG